MSAGMPCRCGCNESRQATVHAIAILLAADDLDAAIDAGLLDCDACTGCTEACTRSLLSARDARRFALASRDRFRAREARLARRQKERRERRMPIRSRTDDPAPAPSLPAAAAAALARAKERAAGRGKA